MSITVHKGCGGKIQRGTCLKCGQKFGRVKRVLHVGIRSVEPKPEEFNPQEYRQRIRNRRDLPAGGTFDSKDKRRKR